MKRMMIGRMAGLAAALWAGTALAAPSWIEIESLPDAAGIDARMRDWSRSFADLAGFHTRTGAYVIAIGPMADPAQAQLRLSALRAKGRIPAASRIADEAIYGPRYIPLPAGTAAPAEDSLSRADRIAVQAALQWRGFYAGGLDGAFGPGTRGAIAQWQAAQGTPATGTLGDAERAGLIDGVARERAALGIERLRDTTAGIAIDMPVRLVAFDRYDPPFARYGAREGSGVTVALISRAGGREALGGLHAILAADLGADGALERYAFAIDAPGGHAQAEIAGGLIKGFVITWPEGQQARMKPVVAAMKSSFTALGDTVLDPGLGAPLAIARGDLTAGTARAVTAFARAGVAIGTGGEVLTAAAGLAQCGRITVDDLTARIVMTDPATGLAVLRPQTPTTDRIAALARTAPDDPVIAGFPDPMALTVPAVRRAGDGGQPGDPAFDATGALAGIVLRGVTPAPAIRAALAPTGIALPDPAPSAPMDAAALTRTIRAVTVRIACLDAPTP